MGHFYQGGLGVPLDYVQSYMWFSLSANNGFKDALKARDSVAQNMTPQQLTEAKNLVENWKPNITGYTFDSNGKPS